jgi:hypothetical protein
MNNKPIGKITSAGSPGLSISIWGSQTEGMFNLKIERSYKDKSGEWKRTEYLSPADLSGLAQLVPKTLNFVDDLKDKARAAKRESQQYQEKSEPAPQQPAANLSHYDDDDIPF